MGKLFSCAVMVVVLAVGVGAGGQASRPATGASEGAVAEAVKTLRESKDAKKWVEAVGVIGRSSDEGAWEALRRFLVNPEVLAVLAVRKDPDEFASYRRARPEATALFEKVARGTKGEETFLWLLKQKVYADFALADNAGVFPVIVLYDALEYVPNASGQLLTFVEKVVGAPTAGMYRPYLMNALAAWGTKESLAVFKKNERWFGDDSWPIDFLTRHRDRIETLKRLVEKFRNNEQLGGTVDVLCGYTYLDRFDEYPLPPFATDAKQAAAVADVLEDFRKNPGKAKLTWGEDQTLKATVTQLRALRDEPPATGPSEAAVGEAVKALRESKDAKKWVEAVGVIGRSSDEGAWEALRGFLVNPEVLEVLAVPKDRSEFASLRRGFPVPVAIFEKMARGKKGEETLLWLFSQKAYDGEASAVPLVFLFEALQHVPNPSGKLLALVDEVIGTPTAGEYRPLLMNALAAWGTKESLAVYKRYEQKYTRVSTQSISVLIRHRDQIETLKFLVEKTRNMDQLGTIVDMLCGDTYLDRVDKYPLPPFATDAKQAAAVADVLDDFRKNPGKAKLTGAEEQTLKATVERLRAAAAK